MNITTKTKYDIGQTVYAVLYPQGYISPSRLQEDYHLSVYEKKIKRIRVNLSDEGELYNTYFLEGLTSYEGENWFEEVSSNCFDEGIFETREEAEEHIRNFYKV